MQLVIDADDPWSDDVRPLLHQHLGFAHEESPPEHVHALPPDRLTHPEVTFFSARRGGTVVGVGALKQLDESHGEVKSMHTSAAHRGQGVARAMLTHLLEVAASRGYERVSLETGSTDAFVPARTLYRSFGFEPCAPFGEYTSNAFSVCMTLEL